MDGLVPDGNSGGAEGGGGGGGGGLGGRLESALLSLQPIRDLSRNWDVDIASCLEDVLNELALSDDVAFSGDGTDAASAPGGHPSAPLAAGSNGSNAHDVAANFSQAALLLQNAGFVYSRKVEYLYALVYQALKDLQSTTSSANGNNTRSGRGSGDASLDDFDAFDPEVRFLLLDDVLPTVGGKGGEGSAKDRKRIDLDEEDSDEDEDDCAALVRNLDRELGSNRNRVDSTTMSGGSRMMQHMTQLSLGGLSESRFDHPNGGASSSSRMGNIINKIIMQGGNSGTSQLRLVGNVCDVAPTGALLMPGSNIGGSGAEHPFEAANKSAEKPHDTSVQPMDDDSDDENGGAGFAMCDDGDDEDHFSPNEGQGTENSPPPLANVHEPNVQHGVGGGEENQVVAAMEKVPDDPWAMLDPHDPGSKKSCPLKVGITYRLPPGLSINAASSVTGARTRRRPRKTIGRLAESERHLEEVKLRRRRNAFGGFLSYSSAVHIGEEGRVSFVPMPFLPDEELPSVPLTGLAYGDEFAYIAKATARRKGADRRARRKILETNRDAAVAVDGVRDDDYDDDDDGYADAFGGFDDGDDGSVGGGGVDLDEVNDGGNGANAEGNVSRDFFDNAFAGTDVQGGAGQGLFADGVQTFEDLCRAHIKAFAKGAEKYAAETHLSRRVGNWQSRLAPILEEEEERPEFDIHLYGQQILRSVKDDIAARKESSAGASKTVPPVVDFKVVTQDSEPYDVCRLFLSSLMLSNSGNIVLSHTEGDVTSPDALQIELLDSELELPMETFQAPSAVENNRMQPIEGVSMGK